MFYDRAKIYVKSGAGGDGMIGFRREKHVPLGGPDGGDGGQGGDVIFTVNPNHNSLINYHKRNHFRAGDAKHGSTKNRTGADGQTLRLEVPPGTVIRHAETGEQIADMIESDQEFLVLRGGRGGRGNSRFTTSVNRAPRLAERGEPGEELRLELELKLIADVGIVGVPNAGKSTLLSVVSAARPKIADYPFTTLQPNLGVVTLDEYETMTLADIPGLIEGAAEGVGLGHDFLRHVERTRILIHLLDGAAAEPLEDWAMINQELALYDAALEERPAVGGLKQNRPTRRRRLGTAYRRKSEASRLFLLLDFGRDRPGRAPDAVPGETDAGRSATPTNQSRRRRRHPATRGGRYVHHPARRVGMARRRAAH